MTTLTAIPVLDFTVDRILDGDTDDLVLKINSMQNKMESWSTHANSFNTDVLEQTGLSLAGGTLSGDLLLAGDGILGQTITLRNTTTPVDPRSRINFTDSEKTIATFGTNTAGDVYTYRFSDGGAIDNYFAVGSDLCITKTEIRQLEQTTSVSNTLSLTTKGYVDGLMSGVESFDGGTVSTNIQVENSAGSATLTLDSTGTIGSSVLTYQRANVLESFMQSSTTRLLLRRVDDTEGHTDLSLYSTAIIASKEMRGVSTTSASSATSFTTKDYVDAEIAANVGSGGTGTTFNGGSITENIEIVNATTSAALVLDSTGTNGYSHIDLQKSGVTTGTIHAINSGLKISHTHSTGGDDNTMMISDELVTFDKPVNGVPTDSSSGVYSFATKHYVDDNALSDSSQVIDGLKFFSELPVSLTATVDSDADSRLTTKGYVDSEIAANVGSASSGGTITADEFVTDGSLTLEEPSGANINHVAIQAPSGMTADYTIVMPKLIGTVGQSLTIQSIVGTVMTMVWS